MHPTPIQVALAILAASLVGALLPLHRRWSERGLHLFVAVSAGVFLGTIFLHLLPHLAGQEHGHGGGEDHGEHGDHGLVPWIAALAGLLVLFALEKVWLPRLSGTAARDPHRLLWAATFAGLSLHAISAGFGLSAVLAQPESSAPFLASLVVHKATETFSLATVMRLAGLSTRRAVGFLCLFALIEPAGVLMGASVLHAHPAMDPLLLGFAAGTFLYVAVCDLLPEVFHGEARPGMKLGAVLVGIGITALASNDFSGVPAFLLATLRESFGVFLDMAPYLLLGLGLAGVVRFFIRRAWLAKRLAGERFSSVAWGAFLGAPLPLCSCSVIPVAASLRRAGAGRGPTSAFAISTPETGIDSLAVTWALLDPILTIARPIGAITSALATGSAVSWFTRRSGEPKAGVPVEEPAAHACCAHTPAPAKAAEPAHDHEHATDALEADRSLRGFLRFSYVEMLDDLAGSLVVGILLAGAIAAALPAEWVSSSAMSGFGGMLLMLVIGVPLYVCASASTPIAAALILKGLSPGAAFVFLLAGPATNAASIAMLAKHIGGRAIWVHLGVLSVCTLALGWLVDRVYQMLGTAPQVRLDAAAAAAHDHGVGWITIASATTFGVLLAGSLVRSFGARVGLGTPASAIEPAVRS